MLDRIVSIIALLAIVLPVLFWKHGGEDNKTHEGDWQMTRDSKLWWIGIVVSVLVAISSRMDLIDPLLPAQHTDKVHAVIELLSLIVGIVSGKLATSPLPGEHDDAKVKLP